MRELWIVLLISVSLAFIEEHTKSGYYGITLRRKTISIPFILTILVMGCFLGLRTHYNDTLTYLNSYENLLEFPAFWDKFNPSLAVDPGFNLVNGCLKTLNISSQSYLMLYAVVTIFLYVSFIRKISFNYTISIFLFFAVGAYTFVGGAIKQSIATAIALQSIPFATQKKWIRFTLIVLLASTFHVYSLIYLIVPFVRFKPWSRKTYILIAGTCAAAILFKPLLTGILTITTSLGESYTVSELSQGGVNIFRVLVCNVPLFLSFLYRKQLFKRSSTMENVIMNLAMVNGTIMFLGLFGTANYFARLANYFVITQAIALPWIINGANRTDRKVLKFGMILGYIIYFYYSSNIVYGTFDSLFHRISIWNYLNTISGLSFIF